MIHETAAFQAIIWIITTSIYERQSSRIYDEFSYKIGDMT